MTMSWPINTGCFFVRNSATSIALLKRWWEYDLPGREVSRVREHRWNDQGAFIDIVWTNLALRKHLAFYTYRKHALAAQISFEHPEMWMLHAPGGTAASKKDVLVKAERSRRRDAGEPTKWVRDHKCTDAWWREFLISGRTGEKV
jgi:hypothetical protein